jgi:uncharacterized protein (DUF2062 family)
MLRACEVGSCVRRPERGHRFRSRNRWHIGFGSLVVVGKAGAGTPILQTGNGGTWVGEYMVTTCETTELGVPRCVVVSPTYNHGRLLAGVLEGLKACGLVVIVVDDGSMDETPAVLEAWRAGDPKWRRVVRLEQNGGKAAALLAGFSRAKALGFTHALTIDSDGQHDPADLPRLMDAANLEPGALVIGMRPIRMAGCPLGSTLGRIISNHFVWVASGVRVNDSQSGLRCYPLEVVGALGVRAGRYGFETEVVTRAGWAGVPVREVPIQCTYEVPGGRVTHFRKVGDSWAAAKMHAHLVGRSLLPGNPVARLGSEASEVRTGTILHRAWWWLGPGNLVRMIRNEQGGRERIAASVGTGLVMATLPLYGIKTVVCLWLAARFRMHPTVVIGVSSLSTPPLGLLFVLLSIVTGYTVLHGRVPGSQALEHWSTFTLPEFRAMLIEWVVGSLIVGPLLGLLAYAVMRVVLRVPRRREE